MQRKKKKDFRKPTIKEEIEIARMIEEKQKKEKDLIKIRMVEEMVPKRFYKYLKMFKRKKLERMPMRKTWNYAIDLRKCFVPKKEKIYPLSIIERGGSGVCEESVEEEVYLTIKVIIDVTSVLCAEERWEK